MKKYFYLLVLYTISINNLLAQFSESQILYEASGDIRYFLKADLDSDGDQDIFQVTAEKLVWLENLDGKGDFSMPQFIAEKQYISRYEVFDLDADQDIDIVEIRDSTIFWLENKTGIGDFSEPKNFKTLPIKPRSFAFTDLNADNKIDVLLVNFDRQTIAWISDIGNRSATHELKIIDTSIAFYDIFSTIGILFDDLQKIAIGDINGDSFPDILSLELIPKTNSSPERYAIIWYENQGENGSFSSKNQLLTDDNKIYNLWLGDLDGDADLDLVYNNKFKYRNNNDQLNWVRNLDGKATFGEPIILDNTRYKNVVLTDFDSDQDIDIIARQTSYDIPSVATKSNNKVVWFENKNGSGLFGERQTLIDETKSAKGDGLVIHDFDKDGDQDLLTTLEAYSGLVFFKNQREKNSVSFVGDNQAIPTENNLRPSAVILADVNGDGLEDLLVKLNVGSNIRFFWMKNEGNTIFTEQATIQLRLENGDRESPAFKSIDLDQDGDLDIFITNGHWLENTDGKGSFRQSKKLTAGLEQLTATRERNILGSTFADLDKDGLEDIIASIYTGKVYWFKNLGNGQFATAEQIIEVDGVPLSLTAVDFNEDERYDLILKVRNDNTHHTSILWYENLGSPERFITSPNHLILVDTERYNNDPQIVVTDFDQDGDSDLVASYQGNSDDLRYYVFYNQGNPYELEQVEIIAPHKSNSRFYVRDLDGDMDLDIITVGKVNEDFSETVIWYENKDGAGTMEKHLITDFLRGDRLIFGDIDQDQDLDIIEVEAGINLLESTQSQIYFNEKTLLDYNAYPDYLETIDVNKDGHLDVITSESNEHIPATFNWLEQKETGDSIVLNKRHPIGLGARAIYPTDIDRDGDTDIISLTPDFKNIELIKKNTNGFDDPIILTSDNNLEVGSAILLYDVDGDQDIDIIYEKRSSTNKISILENIDGVNFTNHLIEGGYKTLYIYDFFVIKDANKKEALFFKDSNALYRLKQANPFGPIVEIDTFTVLPNLIKLDLDKDNHEDLVGVSHGGNTINLVWYKNVVEGEFETIPLYSFRTSIHNSSSFFSVDVDKDNDLDVLYYNKYGEFEWIENIGAPEFFGNKTHIINLREELEDVKVVDMDSDSDMDILYATYGQIGWIENLSIDGEKKRISGLCFYDQNLNKQYDSTEVILSNHKVTLEPDAISAYTNASGQFNFFVEKGSHTIRHLPLKNWELNTAPEQYRIQITDNHSIDNNFGFVPTVDTSIIQTYITTGPTRCGFEVPIWMTIANNGTQTENGTVLIALDEKVKLINSIPSVGTINDSNELLLTIKDLAPTKSVNYQFFLQMPGVEFIDSLVHHQVISSWEQGEIINLQDTTNSISTIRCAYDPNDKQVKPDRSSEANYAKFGEALVYTIRFQNTGTDTAFNIVIRDQLDEYLDWNSLEVLASSHPNNTTISKSGLASFSFENILLPDSIVNEPLSHGFVKFKISPTERLAENTIVNNTAEIYFDFNPPIITNTIKNTFVSNIPMIVTSSVLPATCSDAADGSISINIVEEIPPYHYQWKDSQFKGPSITGLEVGTYEVTITDGLKNTYTSTFFIDAPDPLKFSATTVPSSSQLNDGQIEIHPTGGTAPYQFQWKNHPDKTDSVLEELTNGFYSLTITDANNCLFKDSVFVGLQTSTSDSNCINDLPVSYLHISAMLQGCFNKEENLMDDKLREKGFLPLTEPYSEILNEADKKYTISCGSRTISDSMAVLGTTGENAIVDWVLVELRNSVDTQVVVSRAALIQRDGDIVEADGKSALAFPVSSGDYFIAIRHRNHLRVMTNEPLFFEEEGLTEINFRDPNTPIFGEHSLVDIAGTMALWGGNTNNDDKIIFSGIDNDRDAIFFTIFQDQRNLNIKDYSYNHVVHGYYNSDLNMDGKIIYQGINNDLDNYIFFNILNYPKNEKKLTQYIIKENLPK